MASTSGTGSAGGENDPSEMGWNATRPLYAIEKKFGLNGRLEVERVFFKDGICDLKIQMDTIRNSIVHKVRESVAGIKNMSSLSAPDPFFCRDDIPEKLYSYKEAAALYDPRILPIGLHQAYKNDEFKQLKLKYMLAFLERCQQGFGLDDVVKFIQHHFPEIRDCHNSDANDPIRFEISGITPPECYKRIYEEEFREQSHYLEYLANNIVFVIELFLASFEQGRRDEMYFVFSQPWEMRDIQQDLIMVTNQLPFFIFRQLYDRAFAAEPDKPSFLLLSCHFFANFSSQNFSSIQDVLSSDNAQYAEFRSKLENAEHFTDLVRTLLQLPATGKKTDEETSLYRKMFSTIEWILRKKNAEENLEEGQGEYLYNVAVLRQAGVKFRVSAGRNLCDIEFDENRGEMKIPPLLVDYSTELLFRNLMLWELRYYPEDTYICSYVFLMQFLIKSKEDVDLLIQKKIIINQLCSHDAVITLFYDLCQHIRLVKNNYSGIFQKLNAYNAVRHHSWIATLRLKYFSNLWTGVATVAAICLLVLTLIQAISTVIPLISKIPLR